MFGSILYNLWAALIAFSIYFYITLQSSNAPLQILIGSFVAAILMFFAIFLIRYLVSFILYTPKKEESLADDEHGEAGQDDNANSTVEFQDENTEEIAQVVRTMIHREDEQVNL